MNTKKIRLGSVNPETWDFYHQLHDFFCSSYRTSLFEARKSPLPVFRGRLDRHLLKSDMARFLRSNDVVFFEWASDLLALATSLPKSAKIVTRLHRWELYKWAHLIHWDAVDCIILVSEAKRSEFARRFPEQMGKVHVIPESIDLNRFRYVEKDFSGTIGTLCHIRPRKRVYDLVLTFSELHRRNPSLRLCVGGDPAPAQSDYYEAIQSLIDRLFLREAVRFDGLVKNPREWYRKIDIFISHSYSEGLQVSPMEAMASGCYTLVHRWGGAEELMPDDCLYFTGRELESKISAFCELPDEDKEKEKKRLRQNVADNFDIEFVKEKIGRIIEELAGS